MREAVSNDTSSELHVLDRWCYLGTVRNEQELLELEEARPKPIFDADTYRILTRFLTRFGARCIVVELPANAMPS